ncbi:enoyl-CoA hydratase/isomerase family protein [Microbacterium sp. RD1]|uniref:enoyl-CoA hydratase/isomerase family protein n=1 Tax=Microbacterium sp. RD1 TaxID=3457313 RepID=UPI003FA5B664
MNIPQIVANAKEPDALVSEERVGGVAIVTMQRARAHNALSIALCEEVSTAVAASAGRGARALVLATAGANFSVGADLHERAQLRETGFADARSAFVGLVSVLLSCPIPVVVAASGYTLGGGLEMALAADLIVADRTAMLGMPEVSVGIIPGGGGTQLLARRIGWGRAVDLLLTARRIDAVRAAEIGLIDHLVDDGEATASAISLAQEISAHSASSVALVRAAMREGWGRPLEDGLAREDAAWWRAAGSEDYRAGLEAFGRSRRGSGERL